MDNSKTIELAERRVVVSYAAIDKVVVDNIVKPVEVENPARDYVFWGKKNDYPEYINGLVKGAATLRSIINGCCDYTVGDRVDCQQLPYLASDGKRYLNRTRQTPRDFIRNLARDFFTTGGFCFEVIRSNDGEVSELYNVQFRHARSNKENTVFYYSEDWQRRFGKKKDIIYPKFDPEAREVANSLVYVKNTNTQVYPECPFEGAVIAAELERAIDEYHWNSMNNGFTGACIVNIPIGVPPDEIRAEIEKAIDAKFCGYKNAGRPVIIYSESRDHAANITDLKTQDFSEKYDALAKRSRQQLFTAYRANPNLFGIPTENLGFSNEEYESAFKLFNRTVIQPAQRLIIDTVQSVFDFGLTIQPFTLDGAGENAETKQTATQQEA